MTNLASTIDTYLDAYSESDAERRNRLVQQVWATNGELLDPPIDGTRREGISALGAVINKHYPGHAFHRTSGIDARHQLARYAWELRAADGTVAVNGVDVAEVNDHGQLVRVVGFFGDLPARED
jgi:hypothetical protein